MFLFLLLLSDGEPLKLPESLESLPKSDHFPGQRHRWNTNEVSDDDDDGYDACLFPVHKLELEIEICHESESRLKQANVAQVFW